MSTPVVDMKTYPHPCPRCGKVITSKKSAIHTCCVTKLPIDEAAVEAAQRISDVWYNDEFADLSVQTLTCIITDAYADQHRRHPVPYESERDALQELVNSQDTYLTTERVVRGKLVEAIRFVQHNGMSAIKCCCRYLRGGTCIACTLSAALAEVEKLENSYNKPTKEPV